MIEQYTINTAAGISVDLLNIGAAVASIRVPSRRGEIDVIAPGMSVQDFVTNPNYCGATLGRYANRLASASVRIDGVEYRLSANDAAGRHCLHGGEFGLQLLEWKSVEQSEDSITFETSSPDGDQGFPGQLQLRVAYSIVDGDTLRIDYHAVTDAPTVINLSNHCYFNLDGNGLIDGHAIRIAADRFTPTDSAGIPTGEICAVADTPLDLRNFVELGAALASTHPLITQPSGFDHNFVLNDRNVFKDPVASAIGGDSGLRLDVYTSQPGLQLYTANHTVHPIVRRSGLCLEAQNFPDSPNQAGFPSAILRPGEQYQQFIEYRFSRADGQP